MAPHMRTEARLRRKLESYQREEERKWMKGCVVVAEIGALSMTDRKKLEKLGAVVVQRQQGSGVHFAWPPEWRG